MPGRIIPLSPEAYRFLLDRSSYSESGCVQYWHAWSIWIDMNEKINKITESVKEKRISDEMMRKVAGGDLFTKEEMTGI